ncbi:RibD family protein [Staphylospora marina]|uniref:RibD family protein n=1 Tax=Staphylospora marina TaxID=2490858 RepID=UPI0013DE33A4|nr:dihydrofolate reductase family protein [Staphylospora marina]
MSLRVVTANTMTLDGRIAASSVPSWQDERWRPILEAGFQLIDFAELHGASVILEGSNSFVAKDAGGIDGVLSGTENEFREDYLPRHVIRRFKRWMAVVDSRGRVAWEHPHQGDTHVLALVSRKTSAGYLAFLREREVPYLVAGESRVDLDLALRKLGETFDTDLIVSTAGGTLNGALLRAGLVNEVDLQILPMILGNKEAPSVFEGYSPDFATAPYRLTLLEQQTRPDGSILLRFAAGK